LPPYDLNSQETDFYDSDPIGKYWTAFYYGFSTIVGNEIAPITVGQHIYISITTLFGSLLMATVFGTIVSIMSQMNVRQKVLDEKLDQVEETMR
jgi:hypothetical protein